MPTQPEARHYHRNIYDSKRRFLSYWHQISEVCSVTPRAVLEIGHGNGFVKNYLAQNNIQTTTMDIDSELAPDVVGDITKKTHFTDRQFDVVLAAEVLEHIPYDQFSHALEEIARITTYAVVSIPNNTPWYSLNANLPIVGRVKFFYEKRGTIMRDFSQDVRGHHWEIGVNGITLKRCEDDIRHYFQILKSYRMPEHPSHHFFLLKIKK
ncbi:MAG: methyltransferase domain-containing protein [Patescibacteria group bacterium]